MISGVVGFQQLIKGFRGFVMVRLYEIDKVDVVIRRFWLRVWIDEDYECWIWVGNVSRGKGTISLGENIPSVMRVHRFAYLVHYGELPDGVEIWHTCGNHCCVNPRHLIAKALIVLPNPGDEAPTHDNWLTGGV